MDIVEMTVSCGETYKKRDYESKNYHTSIKTDLSGVAAQLKWNTPEEKNLIAGAMGQIIRKKIVAQDGFQREIIRHIARMDNINSAAVDVQDRRYSEAYQGGYQGYSDTIPQASNPYVGRSDEEGLTLGKAWNQGWTDAHTAAT